MKAICTGCTGQDGSFLVEFLLAKGYEVHGIIRRSSTFNTSRIDHIYEDPHNKNVRMFLHYGDLSDSNSINSIINEVKPDEFYHLGCQSHVGVSFDIPEYTFDIAATGTLRVLEAIRNSGRFVKMYNAASSEMFGKVVETPQKETTPFRPRSPYGCAKVAAFYLTKNYRESYNMFNCSGILFNHTGTRRGETFITRKVSRAATRIKMGLQDKLYIGNLDAKRDWGMASDYVEAMWMMLQHEHPDDYVIASGETHSIRELLDEAFGYLDLNWDKYVIQDKKYMRPAEVDLLLGDPSKAKKELGWKPKHKFRDIIREMVDHDLELAKKEVHMARYGASGI